MELKPLVFSSCGIGRKECRYGLQNLFPVPFASDSDLYKFCKQLHMFQDTRNRAAHEGFQRTPLRISMRYGDQTAEIFEGAFAINQYLRSVMPRLLRLHL